MNEEGGMVGIGRIDWFGGIDGIGMIGGLGGKINGSVGMGKLKGSGGICKMDGMSLKDGSTRIGGME